MGDAAIELRNRVSLHGRLYTIDETYRFDPAHNAWTNVTANGAYRGTAGRWIGASWTFAGIDNEGRPSEVRMTYTTLSPTSFQRDFARNENGVWLPYLSETCKRT